MRKIVSTLSAVLILSSAACGFVATQPSASPTAPPPITITSPAFEPGAEIPAKYTCDGEDSSPPLEWADPPEGTQSFALIVDDPDAPIRIWVHWVVYNLPSESRSLPDSASRAKGKTFNLPEGAVQGKSSFNRTDYGGPCPPGGQHRYVFHLYALDTVLGSETMDKAALIKAMQGHILAQGELMGVFTR
jgi:Raf kinase inhibitor-like YbhB/YbcL family protein